MVLNQDKYIIYHGIKLAENSCIVNCEIETLLEDPTPTRIGRVWYNEIEKVFKYSGLDSQNNVIVKSFSDFNGLSNFLDNLSSPQGANLIGYEGAVTSGLVIPPSSIKNTLDLLANEINTLKNSITNLIIVDEFIIEESGDTILPLSKLATNKNKLMVLINGLEQNEDNYSLEINNNQSKIMIESLFIGDKVKVVNFEIL